MRRRHMLYFCPGNKRRQSYSGTISLFYCSWPFPPFRKGVSLSAVKPQIILRTGEAAARLGRRALDALMPLQCPISGEAVAAPALLSGAGWASLHFIEEPLCRRCGVPFAADYGDGVECPSCIATPPAFDSARAAIVYDDASHKLIVGFKHSDRTELALMFAHWLSRASESLLTARSIFVPAPLHRRRLLSRRYNQSALLAQAIAKQTGAPCMMDLLLRVRATPPQKNLSEDARQRNVAGAFKAPAGAADVIKGAHIVLVDDVLTTGATLSACARALKQAGAARVDGLTIARVVKGGIGAI
jgi:ComF family protein